MALATGKRTTSKGTRTIAATALVQTDGAALAYNRSQGIDAYLKQVHEATPMQMVEMERAGVAGAMQSAFKTASCVVSAAARKARSIWSSESRCWLAIAVRGSCSTGSAVVKQSTTSPLPWPQNAPSRGPLNRSASRS